MAQAEKDAPGTPPAPPAAHEHATELDCGGGRRRAVRRRRDGRRAAQTTTERRASAQKRDKTPTCADATATPSAVRMERISQRERGGSVSSSVTCRCVGAALPLARCSALPHCRSASQHAPARHGVSSTCLPLSLPLQLPRGIMRVAALAALLGSAAAQGPSPAPSPDVRLGRKAAVSDVCSVHAYPPLPLPSHSTQTRCILAGTGATYDLTTMSTENGFYITNSRNNDDNSDGAQYGCALLSGTAATPAGLGVSSHHPSPQPTLHRLLLRLQQHAATAGHVVQCDDGL